MKKEKSKAFTVLKRKVDSLEVFFSNTFAFPWICNYGASVRFT